MPKLDVLLLVNSGPLCGDVCPRVQALSRCFQYCTSSANKASTASTSWQRHAWCNCCTHGVIISAPLVAGLDYTRRSLPISIRLGGMRLTQFWQRMGEAFGESEAQTLARDQVFTGLGDRTVNQALEAGQPAKTVWRVVWEQAELPAHLR